MPKTLDSYLADRVLTRQLYLMRFSAGEKKKVLAVLVDMRAELVAKLREMVREDVTLEDEQERIASKPIPKPETPVIADKNIDNNA